MIPSEQITGVYRQRLKTITLANGYHSDAGTRLYEGWLAHALVMDGQQEFPFIALQPEGDRRSSKSSGGRLKREVSFQIIIAEKAGEGVAVTLQRHLHDLIQALADRNNVDQLEGYALSNEVGDADYNIPEDGYPVAWVALTVTAGYQLILEPETQN